MLSGRHALVADFGVAKAVSEATGRHELTTAGVALGTPAYMAPEQAAADPLTDHRADLYALGVVAYEMLTGEPPFVRPTPQAVLAAQVTEAPVPVTERRGTVPPALASLVMRCLEKRPADRPQRAEEVLGVLEGLATPSGGMTPTETQPVRVGGKRSRRWLALVAGGVFVVALGVAGAWALWFRGPPLPGPDVREPIVVLPFEVQGGDASLESVGVQVADRDRRRHRRGGSRPRGRLSGRGRRGGVHGPGGPAGRSRATGAGTLVTGVIALRGTGCRSRRAWCGARTSRPCGRWARSGARRPTRRRRWTPSGSGCWGRWGGGAWSMGLENPGLFSPPPAWRSIGLPTRRWTLSHIPICRGGSLYREAFARDTTWLSSCSWLWPTYLLGRGQER
jgi:hypothetical protein